MEVKTILVPFDFGGPALHSLAWARSLAERYGASLHLVHVVQDPYAPNPVMPLSPDLGSSYVLPPGLVEEMMKHAETRLAAVLPGARTSVLTGDARREIIDYAARERVDLIVMGTHGRTGAAHLFLGSVAERVVRTAPCPVLTVR